MKRLLFVLLTISLAGACTPAGDTATQTETTATTETAATTEAPATATQTETLAAQEEQPMSAYENKVAELHTSAGDIHIRFYPDVAPNHVRNFIDLAQKGFYDGTKFHRVIPGFMVQGGDPNTKTGDPNTWGTGGNPNKNIDAEFSTVSHKRGIVSMARAQHPNSASSQFFIVVSDSTFLDRQYSVFGQVTKGMEVADAIVNAPRGVNDRPNSPTTINSITIRDARPEEQGPAPK